MSFYYRSEGNPAEFEVQIECHSLGSLFAHACKRKKIVLLLHPTMMAYCSGQVHLLSLVSEAEHFGSYLEANMLINKLSK